MSNPGLNFAHLEMVDDGLGNHGVVERVHDDRLGVTTVLDCFLDLAEELPGVVEHIHQQVVVHAGHHHDVLEAPDSDLLDFEQANISAFR